MDIEDMKFGDIKKIAAMFSHTGETQGPATPKTRQAVLVCTDKRGVVFGYTDNPTADPIALEGARMALYWSSDVGGVFGLADIGPTDDCKISATTKSVSLSGITAIFQVEPNAEKAWLEASVQGR